LVVVAEESPDKIRPDIRIIIRTSRPVATADADFGIFADITNTSKFDIYLKAKNLTISAPPELDPGAPSTWWATINTVGTDIKPDFENEPNKTEKQRNSEKWELFWNNAERVVHLSPGSTTTAFWGGVMNKDKQKDYFANSWRLLSFSPGEYIIKVVVIYWSDEQSAKSGNVNYFTESSEAKINFISPQNVIICGAILGGIIAFLLLPNARLNKRTDFWGITWGIITSVLLSVIITVLISRISDTQFLIRVTINDFWGAVAIGFIANALGITSLNKYLESNRDPSSRTPIKN